MPIRHPPPMPFRDFLLAVSLGLAVGIAAPCLTTRLRGPLNSFTRGSALKLRWLGAGLAGEVLLALEGGARGPGCMLRLAVLSMSATAGTLLGVWRVRASPFWRRVRPGWFRPLPPAPRQPRR